MNITVRITKNYGVSAIYPACDNSRLFARLAGKKTLSTNDLKIIKELGYLVGVANTTLDDIAC